MAGEATGDGGRTLKETGGAAVARGVEGQICGLIELKAYSNKLINNHRKHRDVHTENVSSIPQRRENK
ncbi:hypothetical protein U1Q18_015513, partial [Sarracenia purpurea var. burkii]